MKALPRQNAAAGQATSGSGGLARLAMAGGLLACLVLADVAAAGNRAAGSPAPRHGRRTSRPLTEWTPADWGVGAYIWSAQTADKQTCRLWRSFEIPADAVVTGGRLRILADNSFVVLLDGRELGMGSDYLYMTEYDLGEVLEPGRHVIAVRAFNETYDAGVVVGLEIDLLDRPPLLIQSDATWRVVPAGERGWERRLTAAPHWPRAVEVAAFGSPPWIEQPMPLQRQLVKRLDPPALWQQAWFQALIVAAAAAAALASLVLAVRLMAQSRGRLLLDRERTRIARDIHDELGAGLTQLVLEAEVARTELPPGSEPHARISALCERARELGGALDELVWAVNSRRDTLRDFITFTSKHVRRFLEPTGIRCRLAVADDLPDLACDLHVRRSLLLAVKEAATNAVKHSAAGQLCLRIEQRPRSLLVAVEDDGRGFDLDRARQAGNGLENMFGRLAEIGGRCQITTAADRGCRVEFELPLVKFVHLTGTRAKDGEEPGGLDQDQPERPDRRPVLCLPEARS